MSCLYSELEKNFLKFKDQLVFDNLTYAQLLNEVEKIQFDLSPGAILLAEINSGEFFVKILLAALRAKLIFCPIASDSGDFLKAQKILNPNAIFKTKLDLIHEQQNSEITKLCPDGGFVRFTSGTTGNSKGVLISSESALERINAAEKNFKLDSSDKVLFLMPMPYHFVTSLLMMLKNGVCLTNNPTQASIVYGTPFHYQNLLEADLPNLRLAVSTSTYLPEVTAAKFFNKFAIPIRQSYGIIEAGLPIGDFVNSKSESVGKVLADYQIKFFDGDHDSGILALKGPGLFDAYLEPFQTRSEILRDGWFVTGDFATRDSAGNIFIKGRKTSVIHLAGFKVFPEEIEDVLLSFPGITEAQVVSETHEIYGSSVIAKLVTSTLIDQKLLRKFCKERLGIVKTPKKFEIVDSLLKTSSGKILRTKDSAKKHIAIIGAGLAGCTVGTLLKQAGYNVTIYDHARRPELVVGESLIPALMPIIKRLGLEEEIKTYAQKKPGATIYLDSGKIEWNMAFSDYEVGAYAYNVPRKNFDQSFKNLALRNGCEIKKLHVGAEILTSDSFIVDASGRSRFIANALNIPANEGKRKDVALFAHYDRADVPNLGNIHMDVNDNGWYWRIPLPQSVSVGLVCAPGLLPKYGRTAEVQYDNMIQETLGKYLVGAKKTTQVMKYQNYQLVNENLFGENWVCVGDAAGFADPVFSSGVFLALSSAENLADNIIEYGFSNLELYESFAKTQLKNWKDIIESFYDQRFLSMIRFGSKIDMSRLAESKSLTAQVMGGHADHKALEVFFGVLNYCSNLQKCSNY